MKVTAIKARLFLPPKDDLFSLIKESFFDVKIKEESIIVVTSKIVAIWQGRCIPLSEVLNKDDLIKKEADFYIDRDQVPNRYVILTIKNNILISTSGIDESNANGHYILWPKNPFICAKEIHAFFKKTYQLKKVGVIISDSKSNLLRLGVTGIGIAYYGFKPLRDYRGKKDLFNREIKLSQTNIVDSLADAAVFEMGEGSEQTPIAVVEDVKHITFTDADFTTHDVLSIDKDDDIYAPLFRPEAWKKGGNKP